MIYTFSLSIVKRHFWVITLVFIIIMTTIVLLHMWNSPVPPALRLWDTPTMNGCQRV